MGRYTPSQSRNSRGMVARSSASIGYLTGWMGRKTKAGSSSQATPCLKLVTELLFEFDLNQLKGSPEIFRVVFERIHVHDLANLRLQVLAFPIRIGKFRLAIIQEHRNGLGMAVHHRFFTGAIPDTQNTNFIVLELHRVVFGISFYWINIRLRHSCSCHESFSFGVPV